MTDQPLYTLPSFTRMTFRALAFDALVFYSGGMFVLSGVLTQFVAHRLGYDPELGPALLSGFGSPGALFPIAVTSALVGAVFLFFRRTRALSLVLAGIGYLSGSLAYGPLYLPTNLYYWSARLWPDLGSRAILREPLLLALGAGAAGALVLVLYLASRSHGFQEKADIHGSARLATTDEVRGAGLLGHSEGLLLGLWRDGKRLRYLRHAGPEHAMVFAPTRSGKGVGLVLPNLLTWPHSVLVHDIKGENWALSSGWRAHELGSRCLRFDPTDTTGEAAHYNPLLEVRLGPSEVRDAQTVADILVDPNGDRLRDHWDRTAHALLTAVILHVLYAEADRSLRGCLHFLAHPERTVESALEMMMTAEHAPDDHPGWTDGVGRGRTRTHPEVTSAARAVLDKAENERSGVISTALTFLDLYRDPVVAANTSDSSFRLDDLMHDERPVSLYLTVPSSDLSRTRPLVRMILNQACRRLTERLEFENGRPAPHYRHRLLMMLDEFPALGRLDFFAESLAYLAGYGVRCFLITQDLAQLHSMYGANESITGNCHIRIAFAPNKPETAQLLSRMAGVMTVHQEKRSYKGSRFDLLLDNQYISQAQTQRPLFTPDELMRLPAEDLLLFVGGRRPIWASKIRYFEDRKLSQRSCLPPPQK